MAVVPGPLPIGYLMNIATMQARLRRALGDRANDLNVTELNTYMNSVWQFQIPDIIPGFLREETFILPLVNGQTVYNVDTEAAFSGRCRSVGHKMYYSDGDFIQYFEDQYMFYTQFPLNDIGTGRPMHVLHYARELRFERDPGPSAPFNLHIPGIAYQPAIPDPAGLPNDNHAFCVIRGATRDIAGDLGYEEIFNRYAALFDQAVRRMASQALSRHPGAQTRTRDF